MTEKYDNKEIIEQNNKNNEISTHDITEGSDDDIEDYKVKVIIVGDSGVGKSNIVSRIVNNDFPLDCQATVGVDLKVKTYRINDKVIKLHLWDTAGQERYKSITGAYYRGAHGAMVVYDITNKNTFDNVDKWIKEIKELGGKGVNLIICGNKCDLEDGRKVQLEEGIDKGVNNNLTCIETSAMNSIGVEEAFKKLLIQIYNTTIKNTISVHEEVFTNSESLKIETGKVDEMKKDKGCC